MNPSRVAYFKINLVKIVLIVGSVNATRPSSANNERTNLTRLATHAIKSNYDIHNINNNQMKELLSYFTVDCDYHSIDSNHFQQNNDTFWLTAGSNLTYRCKLIIDARNCASNRPINHRTNITVRTAKLIPANCQDVQIVLQMPDSVDSNSDLVQEDVRKVPYYSGYDQYVAWLNITNFTLSHQGLYQFDIYALPRFHKIYHHQFTLLKTNSTKVGPKNDVLLKYKCHPKLANLSHSQCKQTDRQPKLRWHLLLASLALVMLLLVLTVLGYCWHNFHKNSQQFISANN